MIDNNMWAAIFFILLTIVIYYGNMKLAAKYPQIVAFTPIFLSPLIILLLLVVLGISYRHYLIHTKLLLWFLGPTVAAFAVPIYEQRRIIMKNRAVLMIGVVAGLILNILITWGCAKLFFLNQLEIKSMLTHFVSTPFAIAAGEQWHAEGDLVAIFSTLTGIFGMLIGEILLTFLNLKNSKIRGLMYGSTTSVIGTIKAMQIGHEEGVLSSLTMILSGMGLILSAPLLATLFEWV